MLMRDLPLWTTECHVKETMYSLSVLFFVCFQGPDLHYSSLFLRKIGPWCHINKKRTVFCLTSNKNNYPGNVWSSSNRGLFDFARQGNKSKCLRGRVTTLAQDLCEQESTQCFAISEAEFHRHTHRLSAMATNAMLFYIYNVGAWL